MNTRLPFIAGYAEEIQAVSAYVLRYDGARQVGQAFVDEEWRDLLDCSDHAFADTRLTEVSHETTDDR
jgi:hypothetical protein